MFRGTTTIAQAVQATAVSLGVARTGAVFTRTERCPHRGPHPGSTSQSCTPPASPQTSPTSTTLLFSMLTTLQASHPHVCSSPMSLTVLKLTWTDATPSPITAASPPSSRILPCTHPQSVHTHTHPTTNFHTTNHGNGDLLRPPNSLPSPHQPVPHRAGERAEKKPALRRADGSEAGEESPRRESNLRGEVGVKGKNCTGSA